MARLKCSPLVRQGVSALPTGRRGARVATGQATACQLDTLLATPTSSLVKMLLERAAAAAV